MAKKCFGLVSTWVLVAIEDAMLPAVAFLRELQRIALSNNKSGRFSPPRFVWLKMFYTVFRLLGYLVRTALKLYVGVKHLRVGDPFGLQGFEGDSGANAGGAMNDDGLVLRHFLIPQGDLV